MKRYRSILWRSLLSIGAFIFCSVNAQTDNIGIPDYDAIAYKIVNHALAVVPGEVVVISGTPAELDLLGALQVAVSKAGGQPSIELNIPSANKRAVMETPIEYLKLTPTYSLMQARDVDCFINTGSIQDPKLLSDVPEERLAAWRQSFLPLNDAFNRTRYRSVGLGQTGGIPTKAYADSRGADYQEMLTMFWRSVDADYDQMVITGKAITKLLLPNSRVKLTSKAGTDLTFTISDIPTRVNCGRSIDAISAYGPAQVWLPAGEVYSCVNPTSATGKLVVPSMTFRGQAVKNLRITFSNGRITSLTADENSQLLQERLDKSTGDKDVFSLIDIGINPNSQPLKGSDFYSWEMAGMVTAYMGGNRWAGGNVESDLGTTFHLNNTTLSVDNVTIVSNGKLNVADTMVGKK